MGCRNAPPTPHAVPAERAPDRARFRTLLAIAPLALLGCCPTLDPAPIDGSLPDGVELPTCAPVGVPIDLGVSPCLRDICYRPHTALGGAEAGWLAAWSVNLGWWRTGVVARRIAPDAQLLDDAPIDVSEETDPPRADGIVATSFQPSVAATGDRWGLAWAETRSFPYFVAMSAIDPDGSRPWPGDRHFGDRWVGVSIAARGDWGTPGLSSDAHAFSPVLAADDDGWWIVWVGLVEPANSDAVMTGRVASDGRRDDANDIRVSTGDARPVRPVAAVCGDRLGVAWQDSRHRGGEIYFRSLSTDTREPGFEIRVTDARYDSETPAIACLGDTFALAWSDFRDGNFEIYATTIDAACTVGPEIRVTETVPASRRPTVAAVDGRWVVAWVEATTGGLGAVHSTHTRDGGVSWARPALLTESTAADPAPRIAAGPDAFGLVWHEVSDTRDFAVRFLRFACP